MVWKGAVIQAHPRGITVLAKGAPEAFKVWLPISIEQLYAAIQRQR